MDRAERQAFTLIELLIVVVIVVILLAIGIPQFTGPRLSLVSAPDSVVATRSSNQIAVRVTGRDERPRSGVAVAFEIEDGSGTVSPPIAVSDSAGIARTTWRAGARPGMTTVRITLQGRTRPRLTISTRALEVPTSPPPPAASAAPDTTRADTIPRDTTRRDTTAGATPPS